MAQNLISCNLLKPDGNNCLHYSWPTYHCFKRHVCVPKKKVKYFKIHHSSFFYLFLEIDEVQKQQRADRKTVPSDHMRTGLYGFYPTYFGRYINPTAIKGGRLRLSNLKVSKFQKQIFISKMVQIKNMMPLLY